MNEAKLDLKTETTSSSDDILITIVYWEILYLSNDQEETLEWEISLLSDNIKLEDDEYAIIDDNGYYGNLSITSVEEREILFSIESSDTLLCFEERFFVSSPGNENTSLIIGAVITGLVIMITMIYFFLKVIKNR